MSKKKLKLYSCFLDLKRAAIFFYKNPTGKTYKVFLASALKGINEMGDQKLNKYKKDIIELQKATLRSDYPEKEKMKIADRILTTGILLKSA